MHFLISNLCSLLILLCLLSGCMTTTLQPTPILPAVSKLALSNEQPIALSVKNDLQEQVVGHQYLFIIFPFGRITNASVSTLIKNEAITGLTLNGFKVLERQEEPRIPLVEIVVRDLQLTAYDYIFFRRIVCKITLGGEIRHGISDKVRTWETTVSESATVSLAFEAELDRVLTRTKEAAIKDLLINLGLAKDSKKINNIRYR